MKAKAGIQDNYSQSRNPVFSFSDLITGLRHLNFHVGAVTAVVSILPVLISGVMLKVECHLFIFLSTLFIYNFDHSRISEADRINTPERCHWFNSRKVLVYGANLTSLLSCLLLLGLSFNFKVLITSGLLLMTCLFYTMSGKIKAVPGMKSLIIASVWSISCILLPCFWYGLELTPEVTAVFSGCFLAALTNALLFDIKDCIGDKRTGIKSIPAVLGIKQTVILCLFLSSAMIILSFTQPLLYGMGGVGILYFAVCLQKPERLNPVFIDSVLLFCLGGILFQA